MSILSKQHLKAQFNNFQNQNNQSAQIQVESIDQFVYQPPTQQQYQYKIYINQCDQYVSSQLVEQFRNDHIIQANPNIILASLKANDLNNNNNPQPYNEQIQIPGVDKIIDIKNQRLYNSILLQADIILFVLNRENIKDLEYILKFLKNANLQKQKRLICVTEFLSWAKGRNQKFPLKLTLENLYLRNSVDYHLKTLQNMCLGIHNQNQKVKGSVVFSGLVYGLGQNKLFSYFKRSLQQQKPLQIFGKGTNLIPMIHLKDLSQIVYNIAFRKFGPKRNWHFATDNLKISQKQLINFIAANLGNGNIIQKATEDCFINQNYDFMSIDLQINEKENLESWHCQNGIINCFETVVSQFNIYRGLKPNKILIIGPPVSGKTTIAQILKQKYGLSIINIKSLIEDIKADQSQFATQIKNLLEQLKIQKVQQERKAYQEMKKKKKGKGVEDFDPEKVVPRLPDNQLSKVLKWRLNFSDCLNKGYIIDAVIKNYLVAEKTFTNEENQINNTILPNSIFCIKGTDQQIKERVKVLPPANTQNTHWNEEQTIRRLQTYQKDNEQKSVQLFFQGKVDISQVQFNYESPQIFSRFVERNGPLGFTKQVEKVDVKAAQKEQNMEQNANNEQAQQAQQQAQQQQQQVQQQQFNLQKLTPKQQKILNQKSRPIRQYLIDNVIPDITQGLLQICKDVPQDPIDFLINFLQNKMNKQGKQ